LEQAMLTNVDGVPAAMRHEIALMRESGGSAVTVSANLGPDQGLPGLGAYGAGRAALRALTEPAALVHGAQGVRDDAVSRGPLATISRRTMPRMSSARIS